MSKLMRDVTNRILFGVCSGIAKYTGIDTSVVRILFILGTIFSGSLLFWIYLLMAIIVPKNES